MDTTTPSVSIRAAYARLALTCAGGAFEVRMHLCALRVEPRTDGGAYIIGTDGHTMILIEDAEALCAEPVMLMVDDEMTEALPLLGHNDSVKARLVLGDDKALHLTVGDRLLRSQPGGIAMPAQRKDGTPWYDWRKVLPDFSALRPGLVDPFHTDYAARVLNGFIGGPQMLSAQANAEGVIAWQFQHHPEVLLLVMPEKRGEWIEVERPGWAERWSAVRAQREAAQQPAAEAA
jgi:hypothetical protein